MNTDQQEQPEDNPVVVVDAEKLDAANTDPRVREFVQRALARGDQLQREDRRL